MPSAERKLSAGRRQALGPSLGVERHKDGTPRYWRVRLPVLGPDGTPVPGARREVVRLPLILSEDEAKAEMKLLYQQRRRAALGQIRP